MTATDAIWTQGGSFTAAEDRSLISALTGARHFTDLFPEVTKLDAGGGHGVVGADDLEVTPGAGHSVDVAPGQAFVRGTQSAGQGAYLVGNDATENLAISTPDATNDRIDLVQIRVSDDSAGAGATTIDVKSGTPAGSPAAPTPDENCLVLAEVLVPASAASSASYTVTDTRTRAFALPWRAQTASVGISGGPTSGTTELLLSGSLVIPAAPIARIVTPILQLRVSIPTASDTFTARIRDTNVSGTQRGYGEAHRSGTVSSHMIPINGTPFTVAAGASHTLRATLERATGTGTATVASPSVLSAIVQPG